MSEAIDIDWPEEGKSLEQLVCPKCDVFVAFEIFRVEDKSERHRMILYCQRCKNHFELNLELNRIEPVHVEFSQ